MPILPQIDLYIKHNPSQNSTKCVGTYGKNRYKIAKTILNKDKAEDSQYVNMIFETSHKL